MKVCANLNFLFNESGNFILRSAAAAKAGFKFVEYNFPIDYKVEEFSDALKKNDLSLVMMNAYHGAHGEMGFASTPGAQSQFRKSIETTLPYLRATNCKRTHILSGMTFGPEKFEEQISTMVENLHWASDLLKKEGITCLIEPINSFERPTYFLSSYDTAARIIERVGATNLKLEVDLYHLQIIAGNITNNLKKLLPITGHIQVSQTPNRHEPSFRGELNMDYVFSCIKSSGYSGFIGCEYVPSVATTETLAWIEKYGAEF